ncbi:MAG: hypothetical protein A2X36_04275 [Elusimicrobia bacterium GWA2_69_24]|nr:MAG: hypothetical protein A2X36_04275 [Elusimicrobia bacterium GWA2_69_24]
MLAGTGSRPRPFAPDKILGHKDRVQEWMRTGRSRPVTYELDMTNVCNHRCPGCFGFYPERDAAAMSLERAQSVILQIRDLGGRGLTFTGGGDPLVNPATPGAVEYAAGLGLDVGFITNAQSLRPETADLLLRRCVWIRVSLDAATPEMFRLTHGMGPEAFAAVLENVRGLVRRKRELGSAVTVGVGFLTSRETAPDVFAFAALGRELGVDYAQYRPLLRQIGRPEIDHSDGDVLREMLRGRDAFSSGDYRVVCSEHKYRLIAEGKTERSYGKCYGQHFAAVVAADGKMYVCCHMRGVERYALGDLSAETLEGVWNSERRQAVVRSVDFRDCPPLCRCDSFNGILWDLKRGERRLEDAPDEGEWEHRNFI